MNPTDKNTLGGNPLGTQATGAATARAKEPGYSNISEKKDTGVVDQVSEVASGIANKVSQSYDTISKTASEYYDTVSDKVGPYYQDVVTYTKSNPGTVILTCIGTGFLLGYLLTPRRPKYQNTLRCLVNDSLSLIADRFF